MYYGPVCSWEIAMRNVNNVPNEHPMPITSFSSLLSMKMAQCPIIFLHCSNNPKLEYFFFVHTTAKWYIRGTVMMKNKKQRILGNALDHILSDIFQDLWLFVYIQKSRIWCNKLTNFGKIVELGSNPSITLTKISSLIREACNRVIMQEHNRETLLTLW